MNGSKVGERETIACNNFLRLNLSGDSFQSKPTPKLASANHPKREGNTKVTAIPEKDKVQPPMQDDGIYYELDENDQMVRSEPEQQATGSTGNVLQEGGSASFSRQPGAKAAVVVNVNTPSGR